MMKRARETNGGNRWRLKSSGSLAHNSTAWVVPPAFDRAREFVRGRLFGSFRDEMFPILRAIDACVVGMVRQQLSSVGVIIFCGKKTANLSVNLLSSSHGCVCLELKRFVKEVLFFHCRLRQVDDISSLSSHLRSLKSWLVHEAANIISRASLVKIFWWFLTETMFLYFNLLHYSGFTTCGPLLSRRMMLSLKYGVMLCFFYRWRSDIA